MTFSSDEINDGVSQIVQGSPSYSIDGLGGRNVKERFNQTRELVNSVMLYEPDSVFYLIYKATIKARSLLKNVLSIMDDLTDDLDGMAVPAKAVEDTTALSEATVALNVMSSALARRGSISDAEYRRYEKATDRALDKFAKSARRTYTPFSGSSATTDVVKSSVESSQDLQTNFNTFKTAYETLLTTVDSLLDSFDDYDHDIVISSVAAKQITRITSELETLESDFESRTPDQRARTARVDTLSLLTNRASVRALARARRPGEPKIQQTSSGSILYRASAYGVGDPATITGTVCGPWAIEDSSVLEFDFGGTSVSVPLVFGSSAVPGIKAATMTGYASTFRINQSVVVPNPLHTPYIAIGGSYALTGKWLYLVVDGIFYTVTDDTSYPYTTPFSGNRTPTQLAGDINFHVSKVVATTGTWGPYEYTLISYNNSSPPDMYSNRYIQRATGPDGESLGNWRVLVGATHYVGETTAGWDGNDELWIWPNDFSSSSMLKVDLPNGSWYYGYDVSATQIRDAINATAPTGHVIASVDGDRVVITSGDGSGSELKGEGSILKIQTEGLDVNDKKTESMLGAEAVGFYNDQEVRESDFRSLVVVSVLNSDSDFAEKATAELVDVVYLSSKGGYRSGTDQVSVMFTEEPDGWSSWPATGAKLSIESGENRGVYSVTGLSTATIVGGYTVEFTLDRSLRYQAASGMRLKFYKENLKITAKDAGTGDYIAVDTSDPNSAHTAIGLPTATAYGTVKQLWIEYNDPVKGWVSANLKGLGIRVGDVVLLEDDSLVATVTGIDSLGLGIIDITAVAPTLSLSAFSVESVAAKNHSAFITTLQEWRDGLSSSEENLTDLEKSVNTLLKIKNPVRGRVQTASNELTAIRNILEGSSALSGILAGLAQTPIPAVDRALDVMAESGQDRARSLITSAKFSDYNNTNYKTSSFSGAMMDAASKVAISDFVEPTKTEREFVSEISKLRSYTQDDVDPKYDFGDVRADSSPVYLDYFSADTPWSK